MKNTINQVIKVAGVAVFSAAVAAPVLAVETSTKGGLEVKSDDGSYSMKVGGRIHFDGNLYTDEDDINAGAQNSKNDVFFRRARLTVSGDANEYNYKIDLGFENSAGGKSATTNSFFRDVYIGKEVKGVNVKLGQAKPFRSMEELTSSNDITFMERPFATASAIYPEQRGMGVFANDSGKNYGWGAAAYVPRTASDANTAGFGVNARGYVVPVNQDGKLVHLGLSASADNFDTATKSVKPRVVGREGGLRSDLIAGSTYNKQDVVAVELAGQVGKLTVQGEYATSTFKSDIAATADQDVDAYYVQASYMLTDHVKPYDVKNGVFKSPKIKGDNNALELKARFDTIEDTSSANNNEASNYTLGVNYYDSPNTRYMLEFTKGEDSLAGVDRKASAVTGRAMFKF